MQIARQVISATLLLGLAFMTLRDGASSRAADGPKGKRLSVTVSKPIEREITDSFEFVGRVGAATKVEVRPRLSGGLTSIRFRDGQLVKQGDMLFEIDSRKQQLALEAAFAQVAVAKAALRSVMVDYNRLEQLVAKQVASREELEGAGAKRLKAEAEVKLAEVAAEQAKLELSFTRLTSPITGRIGRAQISVGNIVDSNSKLATIVSLDPMYLYIDMNPAVVAQIRGAGGLAGITARIGLEGEQGYSHQGAIDFVDNHVDPNTGAVLVRAAVPDREQRFMDGAHARVQILSGKPYRAFLINPDALKFDKRPYIFVVNEKNEAERREVEPVREVEGLIAIRRGLTDSDQVVVGGKLSVLREGMEVQTTVVPTEVKTGTP